MHGDVFNFLPMVMNDVDVVADKQQANRLEGELVQCCAATGPAGYNTPEVHLENLLSTCCPNTHALLDPSVFHVL